MCSVYVDKMNKEVELYEGINNKFQDIPQQNGLIFRF